MIFYARQQEKKYNKEFRFTITTNGILLDEEKEKFINQNMYNVVLSLDGRKEINDFMRIKNKNVGSYNTIVPKFQNLIKNRKDAFYYVRGTFTRKNLDFSNDVMHMVDLGFRQISVEPVVLEESNEYAIRNEDVNCICKEYEKLAIDILKKNEEGFDFNFFHYMIDLTGGPCVAKRLVGCGAGSEYIAVTPEADIYPCHQFVGNVEYKIGNIHEGIQKEQIKKQFEKCNVYAKEDCKNCWAKFYCSGGCASNAFNFNKDILKPYEIGCILQKKRIECAIMIQIDKQFSDKF